MPSVSRFALIPCKSFPSLQIRLSASIFSPKCPRPTAEHICKFCYFSARAFALSFPFARHFWATTFFNLARCSKLTSNVRHNKAFESRSNLSLARSPPLVILFESTFLRRSRRLNSGCSLLPVRMGHCLRLETVDFLRFTAARFLLRPDGI